MSCRITYAGMEVKIDTIQTPNRSKRNKINNPTLERAKKMLACLKEEMSK